MARIKRGDLVMVGFDPSHGEDYDYWLATDRGGAYWTITNPTRALTMVVHRDNLTKVEKK